METHLLPEIRIRRLAWTVACAGCLAVRFASQAQAASVTFTQAANSPLAVGGRPTTPVIADLNGDGRADIVVALESDHAIAVLLGRPQGGFQPATGSPFPAGNSPFSIAVADLDGDAKLDVVAVNRTDNQLTALRGDGLGGFSPLGNPIPTGKEPRTVRVADFNRDGKPDLAVANYADNSVSILLADGSGSFMPAIGSPVAVGGNPWGLAVADFNGDGAPDFAVANRADNSVWVMLNDGHARFTAAGSPLQVGTQPFDVAAADLNHDGAQDLVSADTGSHTVTVLLGEGTGKLTRPLGGNMPVSSGYPRMVNVADLDLDGYPDLVTANENSSISVLAGNGDKFRPFVSSPLPQPNIMNTVAVGDLNGDGAPDIVGCGPDFGLTIWLNATVPPAIEVSAPSALESDLVAKVSIRRSANITQALSFLVSTRDDSAKEGRDYAAVQTRIEFAPNQMEKVVSVPLVNDDFGAGPRRFFLEFSGAKPSVSLPWAVPVEVSDDDEWVTIVAEVGGAGLQVNPDSGLYEFPEGTGPIRFTARRRGSVNSTRHFLVHYRVEGRATTRNEYGLDASAAVSGTDFAVESTEGSLDFGPGVTERSVEVTLPGDTVPQGYRGIACHFSYNDVVRGGETEAIVFIRDDERALLRQQVALESYLPAELLYSGISPVFHELPDGKSLVVRANALLRLTRDGLPDLSFGRGTGRAVLPSILSPEESIRFDRVLADRGLQLWSSSGELVRLTSEGIPDTSFGNGTGVMWLPGRLLDTTTDGRLIVASEDGLHLRRLLADGTSDPEFSSAWTAPGEISWAGVSPQGQIWVISTGGELLRITSKGELDPGFVMRSGVGLFSAGGTRTYWSRGYFDQAGRAYFRLEDPLTFGDPTQGMIVRFLADGRHDETYRPVPPGTAASILDLDPDGTALALINGVELVEVDPSGHTRLLYQNSTSIGRANRLSNGAILLSSISCVPPGPFGGGGGCWESNYRILTAEGRIEQLADTSASLARDGTRPWYWYRDETGTRLHRADTHVGDSRVGLAHSGRYVLESTATVSIQRAGSTAKAATVRGRVFPLVAGQWDAGAAQPFEIEFLVGQSDVELALPQLAQPGRQPLREYLVRLESSTGVELSDFTACRLWVVDDNALPSAGGLAVERFIGKDEQNSVLLLGRPVPGKNHRHEFRSRLEFPWESWELYDSTGFSTLGPAWARPVQTESSSGTFFRMVTE